jgi:hypothetical protein
VHIKLGVYWIRTAQSTEIKLSWNKWKAEPCIGPAQTPSAGIGTVPEYWTEQNVPKHAEGQYLLQSEGFYVFFCSNWFLMPIGSEAVRWHSLETCRADLIKFAPSFTLQVVTVCAELSYYTWMPTFHRCFPHCVCALCGLAWEILMHCATFMMC